MKVLYVASEASPFAASGGLGDVMGSLPLALHRETRDEVAVIIPLYRSVREKYNAELELECEGEVTLAWRKIHTKFYSVMKDGVRYVFVENDGYFGREMLYGEFDDGERFAFFARSVITYMYVSGFVPDILHANDWQAALPIIYLKSQSGRERALAGIKTVYTIHNIDYQGVFPANILWDIFDLDGRDWSTVDFSGMINLTKGGITAADAVTTVSQRYSEEIMHEYFSGGLSGILNLFRYKVSGIVNGIDTDYFNPENDREICARYSADNITGKNECRRELCEICNFNDNGDAIVAVISRLASHKGFDLIERIFPDILASGMKVVLLGKGEAEHEDYFRRAEMWGEGKVKCFIKFDRALAKKIYAGSDIFMMPSRSEPCGLAQMIASRYGTVPVVREVGGLYDTIKPYDYTSRSGDGFTFANYNAHELLEALNRASIMRRVAPDEWINLVERIMRRDFTWRSSACEYIKLYEGLLK